MIHNPNVTLMRTTPQENRAIGEWMGARINQMEGPVRLLLPEGGVSALDAPGKPFHDPEADAALFEALEQTVRQTAQRRIERVEGEYQRRRFHRGDDSGFPVRRPASREESLMPRLERQAILAKLQAMKKARQPIIGGGAGTGLSAKCEEAGGIDLIVIYNSGRYRMAGRGSLAGVLAYGNANEIVRDMAREVLPVVKHTPVLAGVNGTDPFCLFDPFLDDLKRLGFSGVQNFPTVGLIDGIMRANLEETGMSYALEVEMIALAHAKDMLTTPYVFSVEEAQAMAKAGADVIVCHLGLTAGGTIGAHTGRKLEECPKLVDEWAGAALDVNPEAIILVHGGPVAEPQDAEFILRSTKRCHGFYGASSMERLPTERAMTDQTKQFKAVAFEKASL